MNDTLSTKTTHQESANHSKRPSYFSNYDKCTKQFRYLTNLLKII